MKDNFSKRSDLYAKYRPNYPTSLIEEVVSHCHNFKLAWDCACGNGQIAGLLSPKFENVFASDLSQKQIDNAVQKTNITYKVEKSESSSLLNSSVDLIVVAQAVHWFQFDAFYTEAKRVLKPNGMIAILGYGLFTSTPEIDSIVNNFYTNIVGTYWDSERKYLDEKYQTIPFPFSEIKMAKHFITLQWGVNDILGYLNTWSAVHHYMSKIGNNPTSMIEEELKNAFAGFNKVEIKIELYTRVGKYE